MKNKLLITTILFIAATALFGQKEYLDGYVVLEQGDTLYGKLEVLSDVKSCYKVIINRKGERQKYKPKHIESYKRGDDKYVKKCYESPMQYETQCDFMKVLDSGKVILYELQFTVSSMSSGGSVGSTMWVTHYFIENS